MQLPEAVDGVLRRLRKPAEFMTAVAVVYALATPIVFEPRIEPFALGIGCVVLQMLGKRIKDLFEHLVPYLMFLLAYDAIRYGRDAFLSADRVTVCGIRDFEHKLWPLANGRTIGDWVQTHVNTPMDLLFAAPYFVFAYVVLGYGLYLYYVDRPRMSRFLWSFCAANLIAFVVWLVFPVAPPWYFRLHGCTAELAAAPSPAGLARVDALLGIGYFQSLYGKSTYVFGAMPSLHCTYPMIGLLTAWRHISWRTKPFHIGYVCLMFCASVYLDHHYVVDGLAGFALAGASVWLVAWCMSFLSEDAKVAVVAT